MFCTTVVKRCNGLSVPANAPTTVIPLYRDLTIQSIRDFLITTPINTCKQLIKTITPVRSDYEWKYYITTDSGTDNFVIDIEEVHKHLNFVRLHIQTEYHKSDFDV